MILEFLENYELFLYIFKSKIYSFLISSISHISLYSIIIFFFLGFITSLTPCLISVIPFSLAYINMSRQNYYYKNFFLLGLISSTLLIMFLFNAINYQYLNYFDNIPIVFSLVLCLLSLNLLQVVNLSALSMYIDNIFNSLLKGDNLILYNYLNGFAIGLSALPCSSSIIFIISFWLFSSINLLTTLFYLITFILGYIISILLIFNLAFNYTNLFVVSYMWELVMPLSGFVILTFSLLNILEKLFI
uniref:Thiol:disulfide interchange protein n=1 Tax=Ptilothamnion sphaericum TaxID=1498216 RepID=A0A4D6WY57_9FLOR|nr:Thiol:disulfide interchange protein [Ptilothamnion sphaericum]QCI08336.1 Thiol:disulfide interchange protein [Ptilothamnion sphaericum]